MRNTSTVVHKALISLLALGTASALAGCVVVGGSSRGGFFIWPGSLGLLLMLGLLFLLLRRR